MRHHTPGGRSPVVVSEELAAAYDPQRTRVDAAYRRMRGVVAAERAPVVVSAAAADLSSALHAATATVTGMLQALEADPPRCSRRRPHRKGTRSVSPDVAAWSAELLRLTEISGWLRRTTLADLGLRIPTVVRVGSRAASGPHIAGMAADPDDLVAAVLHEPWIGVDLREIVAGDASPAAAVEPVPPVVAAAPKAA